MYKIFFFGGDSTRFRVMASPYGASRSHSWDMPHSVGLLWTSDQSAAETCPTIQAMMRLQTDAIERVSTGFGVQWIS